MNLGMKADSNNVVIRGRGLETVLGRGPELGGSEKEGIEAGRMPPKEEAEIPVYHECQDDD
jgi:hypothetical protein